MSHFVVEYEKNSQPKGKNMQNIKEIIAHPESYKKSVQERNLKDVDIDGLIGLYRQRNELLQHMENLRAQMNQTARSVKDLQGEARQAAIEAGQALKAELKRAEEHHGALEEEFHQAMLTVPNLLPDDTPLGFEDAGNVCVRTFSQPRRFDFEPKDHLGVAEGLDLIDFENGAKTTGAKFYYLKNDAVLLEAALKRFVWDILKAHGFHLLKTPDLARQSVLSGSGFNPRGAESNIYNIEGTDLSLIATAEITIGGLLSQSVFKQEALPLFFAAESHCFRREAGGAGQESKGLYRVHQFDKLEMYCVCTPDQSHDALEKLVQVEEEIYQKLGLAYQVMRVCAGDLGAPAYQKYDIEAWMPGKGTDGKGGFGEITSASNCTDFQSRRLNIKYKDQETGKKEFAHTLNGTAMALSRVLLAVWENYQQADGSVVIPEALRPYTGFDKIEKPAFRLEDVTA